MKTIITTLLLMLIYKASLAQNGGQFFENNLIKIQYIGYSDGAHIFKVCNKQACEARIRIKVDRDQAVDIQVGPKDCNIANVIKPATPNLLFRAKAETACVSNPDMGWLEINTANVVLNLVEGNTVTIVRGQNTFRASIINGLYSSDYGSMSYVENIVVYDILGMINYKASNFVRKYSSVNLKNYLQPGLNFVEVTIETNRKERFVFKYVK